MNYEPPADWLRLTTLDAHTAGEPLRVITGGFPALAGATILDRRRDARQNWDHLRRALMLEPRGHADMYGCLLMPPATDDGDVGVLFLHNEGYSTMCGHGIIGLVKVGLECGLIELPPGQDVLRIDTPAGRVTATAHRSDDGVRVDQVSFLNVPSFLHTRDLVVEVAGYGAVTCDVGYGGAFYACLEAQQLGLTVEPANFARLAQAGMAVKRAVMEQHALRHPDGDQDLNFLYGTIFSGPAGDGVHSRNVCIFADGEVDRSPTGTGVSCRAAILHARGELPVGERITIESLIGTRFDVSVHEETTVGALPAVVPEVRGAAYITGRHEFFVDPADPLRDGVLLR